VTHYFQHNYKFITIFHVSTESSAQNRAEAIILKFWRAKSGSDTVWLPDFSLFYTYGTSIFPVGSIAVGVQLTEIIKMRVLQGVFLLSIYLENPA